MLHLHFVGGFGSVVHLDVVFLFSLFYFHASRFYTFFLQLQKVADEQQAKIHKLEHALQVAEVCFDIAIKMIRGDYTYGMFHIIDNIIMTLIQEEVVKAKLEASSRINELLEVWNSKCVSFFSIH